VVAELDKDGKINPDSQGNETAVRNYDVCGLIRNSQQVAPGTSDHKFVGSLGHTTEPETGLIYMRARYMDPVLGRFISEDPACNDRNWYAYCGNNPINTIDANGQFDVSLIATGLTMIYQALAHLRLAGREAVRFYNDTVKALATDDSTVAGFLLKTEYQELAIIDAMHFKSEITAGIEMIAIGAQLVYMGLL
jgi:RHS repeat-associated protein